jgi:hypothetical protein
VDTSKGPAVIPAWRFTMAELSWPVTEAAVAAGNFVTLPSPFPLPPAGRVVPGVGGLFATRCSRCYRPRHDGARLTRFSDA